MGNSVCWLEFYGSNVEGKSKFFKDVFGWEVTPHGATYAMWSSGEGEMGGGIGSEEKIGQCTIAYIEVDDIEAKLKVIEGNGGSTVIPKTKISDEHGFFAHFTDCCGTRVGLWSKT